MNSDFFKKLNTLLVAKTPFVVFRKPHKLEVTLIEQEDKNRYICTDFNEEGYVFAPFDSRKEAVLFPENKSKKSIHEVQVIQKTKKEILDVAQGNSQEHHLELLKKGIRCIQESEIEKIVLSRKEMIAKEGKKPIDMFHNLLATYSTAYVYLWFHPKVGTWLGASPEGLLEIDNRVVKTMSLAGTQVFISGIDAVWKQKEIKEQQFVTDFVKENLKPFVKEMTSSKTYTTKAGSLLHLRTDIEGTLKRGVKADDLIQHLHPTPAVCGLPKNEAKTYILEHEGYDRTFYTGFLGELNCEQKTSLYVNLRCMELTDKNLAIYIGGGITKDSDPENEWQETVSKAKIMKGIL
ncbi:MAG: isochorismate synthase [Flavobacteriaceae bacterium]|nr:MAG: isochorismate synthase [Flavobacteriaceae bacterium]